MINLKDKGLSLLRWSEKYTKTDMVYLFKGGFWLGIWQVISSSTTFVVSIAFANLLSQEEYGIYRYVLSLIPLLSLFSLSGMNTAVNQAIARGLEGSFWPAFKAKIQWGFLGSLISALIAIYYYLNGNQIIAYSFLAASITLPLLNGFTLYYSLLSGRGQFKKYSLYDSVSNVVAATLTIVTLVFTNNVVLLVTVFLVSNTVLNGIFFFLTIRSGQLNDQKDPGMLTYGKSLSLAELINIVATQLDKILIFQYIGAIELAVYTFALAPTEQIKGVFKNVNSLAFPKLAQTDKNMMKKYLFQKLVRFGVIMSIPVAAYILLAPYLFRVFFPAYASSVIYSQILALSIVFSALATFLYTVLNAHVAQKQIYQYQIFGHGLSITLLFIFIFYFGLMGVIISRLVSRLIFFILPSYLVNKI